MFGVRRLQAFVEPILVTVAVLSGIEILSLSGVLPSDDIPPVSVVAQALFADVQGNELWHGVGATMGAWALGLFLVTIVAVPAGMLLGTSDIVYRAINPTLEFVRTIPSIAALPILIFLYGVGMELALVLVMLTAVWPLLIQTSTGVKDVDPLLIDVARMSGLSRIQIFFQIALPSAAPYIATGLRLSGTFALILSVAASLLAGGDGLGSLIVDAAESAHVPLVYSRLFVAGFLGLIVAYLFTFIESRFLRWHPSYRETAL